MSTENHSDTYSNPTKDMAPIYNYNDIVQSNYWQQRSTVDQVTQTDYYTGLMARIREMRDRYKEVKKKRNALQHTTTVLNDMLDRCIGEERILRSIQIDNYQPVTEVDIHGNINVILGKNNTTIPLSMYNAINWKNHSNATRKLLAIVFTRKTLATHTLSGKPSPAFLECSRPEKPKLDPKIVSDIVEAVSERCRISESVVRSTITTKCADESKMHRRRKNKENFPASPKRRF